MALLYTVLSRQPDAEFSYFPFYSPLTYPSLNHKYNNTIKMHGRYCALIIWACYAYCSWSLHPVPLNMGAQQVTALWANHNSIRSNSCTKTGSIGWVLLTRPSQIRQVRIMEIQVDCRERERGGQKMIHVCFSPVPELALFFGTTSAERDEVQGGSSRQG